MSRTFRGIDYNTPGLQHAKPFIVPQHASVFESQAVIALHTSGATAPCRPRDRRGMSGIYRAHTSLALIALTTREPPGRPQTLRGNDHARSGGAFTVAA